MSPMQQLRAAPQFRPGVSRAAAHTPAFDTLSARRPETATHRARMILQSAPRCQCCSTPASHVISIIGSTFFLDDEPGLLARAFPAGERGEALEQLIAACIVLLGRARTTPWS